MLGRATLKGFDDLWKFARRHGDIVQLRNEIEYVFNLIRGCSSYLEVGTAEGNSLYILAHALTDDAKIAYIDWAEVHTKERRDEALEALSPRKVIPIHADTHSHRAIDMANAFAPYDVVLIDAGHLYEDVIMDAVNYGSLAKKFIIFHDTQIPAVRKAFDWYCKVKRFKNVEFFQENQSPFGYGIITL